MELNVAVPVCHFLNKMRSNIKYQYSFNNFKTKQKALPDINTRLAEMEEETHKSFKRHPMPSILHPHKTGHDWIERRRKNYTIN